MLNEQEQLEIRLISDNDLYQQALEFMNRMGGLLSQTQINGLLNVSLANTYDRFEVFVKRQGARKTWPQRERHVEHFYKITLPAQLAQMAKTCVPAVLKHRQEAASREDVQAIKMALAREFLQHLRADQIRGRRSGPITVPRGKQIRSPRRNHLRKLRAGPSRNLKAGPRGKERRNNDTDASTRTEPGGPAVWFAESLSN